MQWEVKTTFKAKQDEPKLKATALLGLPVLYQPSSQEGIDDEMKPFVNRYLGHVKEIQPQGRAIVDCKDHIQRHIPLIDLFLEASPLVIREYEKRSGLRSSSRSIWHKLQELNFVLSEQGRRNASVLKDRLQAVRLFLGGGSKEQLIVPAACFQEGSVIVGLSPERMEVR